MDAKTREQLKVQYPNERLYPITSDADGIEIIVRPADPGTWLKYRGLSGDFADAGKRALADELLVLGCVVWPERSSFEADIAARKLTGFYRSAAPFCSQITGARENLKLGEAL